MNNSLELNFEDFLLIVFIALSLLNIYGNYNSKLYQKTNDSYYKYYSNKIFKFTLSITLLIYIYFFYRNYTAYQKVSDKEKKLYSIKVFGTIFLITGILCLLYFQNNETDFFKYTSYLIYFSTSSLSSK